MFEIRWSWLGWRCRCSAYATLADDEYGLLGAVTQQIAAAASAAAGQTSGLAGADQTLSVESTGNLADFTVLVQAAASKAAKSGVAAETQYDLARAGAKRDYNNDLAVADLARATEIAWAGYDYIVATPLEGETPEWLSTPEGQTAFNQRNNRVTAAGEAHAAALKTAKVTHAGKIGVARIDRVVSLGAALITEATESGDAEIAYVTAQNADDEAYVQNVTTATTAGVAGLAMAAKNYAIAAAGNIVTLVQGLGAAAVALAEDMKPVNVTHTTSLATYEGIRQESNLDLDLRTVACPSSTPRGRKLRSSPPRS